MNRKIIINAMGTILIVESALMLLPAITAAVYGEKCIWAFLITIVAACILGAACKLVKPKNTVIYAKEGFVIVALTWIILSVVGAVPFVLSKAIPNFVDAFFETVSGFTTTGASVVGNVEALPHGILFWRSFTHWVGGMGILVFVMAVLPNVSDRPMHILRAEMPGPIIGKLLPKARDTAKILYLIYVVMTAIEVVFLLCGGMTLFESLLHAFGTAGTGGFGIKSDSLGSYSPYLQWVITVFMLLFAINFNLYYLLLIRRFRAVTKSGELWFFLAIVGISVAAVTGNIYSVYGNLSDSLRHSSFQVASIISTTGYSTANFDLWPTFSKTILLVLMFIGGCAGSTAGGIKVSRILLMFKIAGKEIRHLLHPRAVNAVRLEGKPVDNATVKSVSSYFLIYFICFFAVFILLGLEPLSIETNFSAAVSCFNNVGPGLAAVGPMESYGIYSAFSKVLLSFAMLFGRLEIFPMIILFAPSTWKRNK